MYDWASAAEAIVLRTPVGLLSWILQKLAVCLRVNIIIIIVC